MAYIGNTPAENYGNLTVQHFAVTATDAYVLDTAAANENEIALFINNVRQQPGESYAYTVSGTALTLSAATAATDTMYCLFLGKAQHTSLPGDGTITNAMLVDIAASKLTGTIDNARISLDAAEIPNLDASKITTGTIDNARISLDAAEIPNISTDKLTTGTLPDARIAALAASKLTGVVPVDNLGTGATSLNFLRGDGTWQVVSLPVLDSPVITGTLSLLSGGSVSHTVANWSDDVSYTIVPTNCTVGAVNGSGVFVVTHTSGAPSYTIKATTDSLGLADSAIVTKNIVMTLTAPTLSSPADVGTAIDVVYTITSTDTGDDKLILDPGTANFTYQSEAGPGTASKVGNTVECVGFGTGNPVVTIQFTAQATYSVTATAVKIDGTYGTSAASSADSITIANRALTAPAISSPADVGTATDVTYTITSNDAEDNKLILNIGSSNFTLVSVTPGAGSIVGNTVEVTGFTTNNPAVVIQYTAEATYSVTATAVDTAGYYGTSAASSADSITIANTVYTVATGGAIVNSGDYKIHTFTSSSQSPFTITTLGDDAVVQYLIVAAGGSGGAYNSGGGGAGGYLASGSLSVSAAPYSIVIGGGGAGAYGTVGAEGTDSTGFSLTADGGGRGGSQNGAPTSGGSGGGGSGVNYPTGAAAAGSQGNAGGDGYNGIGTGGGGGGSAAVGANYGPGNYDGGDGGAGTANSINGVSLYWAAGGGAGAYGGTGGNGGIGGGGGASMRNSGTPGNGGTSALNNGGNGGQGHGGAGGDNTGSGGGAANSHLHNGGNGGSGVVIIKYLYK